MHIILLNDYFIKLRCLLKLRGAFFMKIIGRTGLSGMVKLLIEAILVIGAVVYITLPFFLKCFMNLEGGILGKGENYAFLVGFLYFVGAFLIVILFEIRRIFSTINSGNPFQSANAKSLKMIALMSLLITGSFIVKIFFFNTILTMATAVIFLIAGLFSVVLAEVFKQAVAFKEENDLTI
jgi:hypothetical protein